MFRGTADDTIYKTEYYGHTQLYLNSEGAYVAAWTTLAKARVVCERVGGNCEGDDAMYHLGRCLQVVGQVNQGQVMEEVENICKATSAVPMLSNSRPFVGADQARQDNLCLLAHSNVILCLYKYVQMTFSATWEILERGYDYHNIYGDLVKSLSASARKYD